MWLNQRSCLQCDCCEESQARERPHVAFQQRENSDDSMSQSLGWNRVERGLE